MYFTDRGIEELAQARRGEERGEPWRGWPSSCGSSSTSTRNTRYPIERLATWLARLDDEDE
jgi:hypothetical protein